MRVLWFTNIPMPAMDEVEGLVTQGSGSWMIALLAVLSQERSITLGVATAYPHRADNEFTKDGVDYFLIGQPSWDKDFDEATLIKCSQIIQRWKPDLVHIHGTERFYGLITGRGYSAVPAVLSVQGLLGPYSKRLAFFGELSDIEIIKTHWIREYAFRKGLLRDYLQIKKRAKIEREILFRNHYFLGRTEWDKAHVMAANPSARYFHGDEMIRRVFFDEEWRITRCRRHSILFTNSGHPRRGTEVIIDAVAGLVTTFPDIHLTLAGNFSTKSGYGRFLVRRLQRLGIYERVSFPGFLSEAEVAAALRSAHVFVIASYVENSPNSLCEAMVVGVPCIAGYTGGIPSLITHRKDGLLFPCGESVMLSQFLREVFENDALAVEVGANGRRRARLRHDSDQILASLLETYRNIVSKQS